MKDNVPSWTRGDFRGFRKRKPPTPVLQSTVVPRYPTTEGIFVGLKRLSFSHVKLSVCHHPGKLEGGLERDLPSLCREFYFLILGAKCRPVWRTRKGEQRYPVTPVFRGRVVFQRNLFRFVFFGSQKRFTF